jgi:hypothetical protein
LYCGLLLLREVHVRDEPNAHDRKAALFGHERIHPDRGEEWRKQMIHKLLMTTAAFFLIAGPAAAATVKNTGNSEITIGIDHGNKEMTKTIAAGQSAKLDCPDGCGVTGPWGFSWMVSEGDSVTTDGKPLVTVTQ